MMGLSEAAKKARRAYMKTWRENNEDRVRTYRNQYWERVAQQEEAPERKR